MPLLPEAPTLLTPGGKLGKIALVEIYCYRSTQPGANSGGQLVNSIL
ncbi:MAG TPA: hypothetical protein VMB49_01815 [Acidobacteriaceae bacterium]|nr:hypothetical protein [Acidobacteriaceae bacterium]